MKDTKKDAIVATGVANTPVICWQTVNKVTDGTTNEQLALIQFANLLGSSIVNDEPSISNEKDVRNEARLLMSLSCTSPTNISEESGRASPENDSSSCQTYSSTSSVQNNSFTFTCPSLSLENPFREELSAIRDESSESTPPAALLGRILKVDDRDALRLSAEAMARNVMQSYQKAMQWRIQSWVDQLSRVLASKESFLQEQNASEKEIKALLESGEAKLIRQLRELEDKIHVGGARTYFKILPQRLPKVETSEPASKKLRMTESSDEEDMGFQETEYKYHVKHTLTMEGDLSISTPAGYVHIDIKVPGTVEGTFLSSEPGVEELTAVQVEINTEMLASMIEKSSRIAVRSSVEALLTPEPKEEESTAEANPTEAETEVVENRNTASPEPTVTPKRKYSHERVSGFSVVTPSDTSSPSSCGDSDHEDKPVLLSIPDDFSVVKSTLRMVTPQPSFARSEKHGFTFTPRAPGQTEMSFPSLVSPTQTSNPSFEAVGKSRSGPCLPVLVEVACAARHAN
jgi:hypothetical protein